MWFLAFWLWSKCSICSYQLNAHSHCNVTVHCILRGGGLLEAHQLVLRPTCLIGFSRWWTLLVGCSVHFVKVRSLRSFVNYVGSQLQSGLITSWWSLSTNVYMGLLRHILLTNSTGLGGSTTPAFRLVIMISDRRTVNHRRPRFPSLPCLCLERSGTGHHVCTFCLSSAGSWNLISSYAVPTD